MNVVLNKGVSDMGLVATPVYYKDDSCHWRWQVNARNGEIIDASSEGFSSKTNAVKNYELNHVSESDS